MNITRFRGRRPSLARAGGAALVLAAGLVALTPGVAAAAPGGGPTLTAKCNQYTNLPQYGDWKDDFTGLIGNSSAAYRVDISYEDPATHELASSYDYEYWYADPDGTYHHTYVNDITVPISGTAYTWGLTEFSGGSEYDNLITGSGIVGGPNCPGKPQKPNQPAVSPTTYHLSHKGKFTVTIGGDAKTTGDITVTHSGDQLATGSYALHSNVTTDVTLKLSKADLKHLIKVRSETVKFKSTARNTAGTVKNDQGGTLYAPPKK